MADNGDLPDIRAIQQRLQSDWAERDDIIETIRDIRFMRNAVDVPAPMQAEVVQTPVGHQIIERMKGALTTDPLTITVPPSSEKADAQEQSSKMEKFALTAFDQLERQADQDVIDNFVESQIADGHACMRMLYARTLWRGFPRRDRKGNESDADWNDRTEEWKRGKPLPIAWNWVDPLTVYPLWGEFGLEGILEVSEQDVLALHAEKWNVEKPDLWELSRLHEGSEGSVTFQQWWTPETLTYAVEGEIVHHTRHRYGVAPYVYAFGLGAASNEPALMGMSVLYPLRYLIPYLDRVLSQKASAVRMWCWPTIIFKQTGMGDQLGPDGTPILREVEIAPGATVDLYQDEEISFLTWRGNGPDADEVIQLVMGMIERAGLADTSYGQSRGESGYAINQLLAAARMRYKPIVKHAERALEQQVARLFDVVEYQAKQSLHVYNRGKGGGWITLAPDDLRGYRQVQVRLNPLLPTDTYARSSQALNEVRGGLRDRASAMEMIGIEQPDEMKRRIDVDLWRARPEVQAFFAQEAVHRAGLKLQKGDVSMSRLQRVYPDLGPGLQQAVTQRLNAAAPAGQTAEGMGMTPTGPPGGQPGTVTPQIMQAIQMIAQRLGQDPQQLLQQLMAESQARGISLEVLVQMLLQRLGLMPTAGGQPGAAPGAQIPGYRPQGAQVMAQPGVRAQPTPPTTAPAGARIVRPSGMATGKAPGAKRRGPG